MAVQAEIQCLNCGRPLAEFEGELDEPMRLGRLSCRTGRLCFRRTGRGRVVCSYCGGKPVLADVETVVRRVEPAAYAAAARRR